MRSYVAETTAHSHAKRPHDFRISGVIVIAIKRFRIPGLLSTLIEKGIGKEPHTHHSRRVAINERIHAIAFQDASLRVGGTVVNVSRIVRVTLALISACVAWTQWRFDRVHIKSPGPRR